MGVKERRERERQELRQKILAAARELFAELGYEAVTMRKIAQRIEYSPTAIYFHFKDKLAVFRELCESDFRDLAQGFLAIGEIADPVERLRAIGLAYGRFAFEHPHHYRLMFMTRHPQGADDDTEIEKGNPDQDAYAFLRATVSQAIEAGLLRPELKDADLLAQVLWGTVHGIVSLHLTKGEDDWFEWRPAEETIVTALESLRRGTAREEG